MFIEAGNKVDGVAHRISHDNLHIKCQSFNQDQVNTVMGLVQKFQKDCHRIFIDVRDIQNPSQTVAANFKSRLENSLVSPSQIFFKGNSGFKLAINGNRVLVQSSNPHQKPKHKKDGQHVCCGKCKHCHCHDHKES